MTENEARLNIIAYAASEKENLPIGVRKAFDVAAQALKKTNNWIPCSERLPEDSLNSVIGWDEFRARCCFVQYYNGRWLLGNDDDVVNIIAWRPLPEPYKESEEE